MNKQQLDIFGDSAINQQNPLINRRVGFIGTFKNRAALVKKVKELGASDKSKDGLTRDTQILVMGNDVKQEDLNRLKCYEHDGWKPLKITETELLDILNGHYVGFETPTVSKKQVSIDMSYYNWTPPVLSENENEDDTGLRCSSPLIYGEENPVYGMEIYVPNRPSTDIDIIRQLVGNFGGFANTEYFDETNIIMLSGETLRLLEQGVKDDVIKQIEQKYNQSSTKMFNIQFTCEADFISWVRRRMGKYPDESTMELLEKYEQSAQNKSIYMNKIKPKECQNVEFKCSWQDEFLKWICGFANAQGAVMYFGVNDDHEVVGLANTKRLLEDIPNKIVSTMGIMVDVNLHEQNGLDYIEVVIDSSNIPISYKGKYYYRSGSTMQELRGPALQQFVLKKMGRSWDDVTCDRAKIEDIDRDAIDFFLRKGIDAQRIPEDQRNALTEDILTSLGLMDDNGGLKNAAVLLFGKKPQRFFPSAIFKIGRFGRDESDLMFQDVIEGNIIQMAERVMDVLQAKYLISPIHFEGMSRIEKLEVPKEAMREILYNAIAHKDYTGSDIQMHVYDNHLEIWNEGELPEGYTQETLFGRHSSKPRNRYVANAFFKAGFIDTWGRGYKKICQAFKIADIPMPKVENFCGGVQVTIERTKFMQMMNVTSDVSSNVVSNVDRLSVVQLTDRQKKIRELVLKDPFISTQQMSVVLSVVKRTVERDLADLQKKGVLVREGNTSAGHWIWVGTKVDIGKG